MNKADSASRRKMRDVSDEMHRKQITKRMERKKESVRVRVCVQACVQFSSGSCYYDDDHAGVYLFNIRVTKASRNCGSTSVVRQRDRVAEESMTCQLNFHVFHLCHKPLISLVIPRRGGNITCIVLVMGMIMGVHRVSLRRSPTSLVPRIR